MIMNYLKGFLVVWGLALLVLVGSSTANAAPAQQTAGTSYVVKQGDTLASLAERVYGNKAAWQCIWNANRWIVNPSYVQVGWTIQLPASGACGGPAATPTPPPIAGTTYTVQRGDTLAGLAVRAYGNKDAWRCIWAANTWITNPSYIVPGWKITIPASGACGGPTPAPRYHTVTRSETLSAIACYYYADCNYWRIYEANKSKIWNVNYILPGTVLLIP
jgi:nucleoid-associated protein YgaU